MICSKCGLTCNSVSANEGKDWVSTCCEAVAKEKTEMNNDWKDLEIGDLTTFPKDFFTNDRIELRNKWKEGDWYSSNYSHVGLRLQILKEMMSEDHYTYQWRLKPLKPIRVTEYIWNYLLKESNVPFKKEGEGYICVQSQRPVEIIEE